MVFSIYLIILFSNVPFLNHNLIILPKMGKFLINTIEAIRRKPISQKVEETLTLIGFGFLMVLMFLVTWNDLRRYFF